MRLRFPPHFLFGTATSAAQIETAFDHQFKGIRSADGYVLERTIDHERRRQEDAEYIASLSRIYRCGVDWSRLQRTPLAPFDAGAVEEYRAFFRDLNDRGVKIMLVLHHFAHPNWLEEAGGWTRERNIPFFVDFARRCHEHFGPFVHFWNTFNEPNAYAAMAFLFGQFPPRRHRSLRLAERVLRHMGAAHDIVYDLFHSRGDSRPVGIALSLAWFEGIHPLGRPAAWLCDRWYNRRSAGFFGKSDFWGINYYAYVPFDPRPVTEVERPGRLDRLGLPHDRMWGYAPEKLGVFLERFHRRFQKPVMVTEGGICTDDPNRRIAAIGDQLIACHQALENGVDLQAYIHWSTFDNFEWTLGPTYRFGLVRVNLFTKERSMTAAGEFYRKVVETGEVETET